MKRNVFISVGAIHSTKIQTGPTGKRGPPQEVDQFFRNFSGWTEPIHGPKFPEILVEWLALCVCNHLIFLYFHSTKQGPPLADSWSRGLD